MFCKRAPLICPQGPFGLNVWTNFEKCFKSCVDTGFTTYVKVDDDSSILIFLDLLRGPAPKCILQRFFTVLASFKRHVASIWEAFGLDVGRFLV